MSVLATEPRFRAAFVQVGSGNVGVGAGGAGWVAAQVRRRRRQ